MTSSMKSLPPNCHKYDNRKCICYDVMVAMVSLGDTATWNHHYVDDSPLITTALTSE
jgi:hypothetical protein